jgi:hypothetical protein
MAGGGLLVDLTTGSYFRLNASAVEICRALLQATNAAETEKELAGRLRVSTQDAAGLLRSMESALETPAIREEPVGPFRYVRQPDSYELVEHGRPILTVDTEGQRLRMRSSLRDLNYPVVDYLRAVAPKILRLRGIPILHASACILAEGAVTAFSGKSGAGKTTTATAFQAAGATLVSEDLVVMSATGDPRAYLRGEEIAHGWSARMASVLTERPETVVPCEELSRAAEGAAAPLRAVWFVDAERREGAAFQLRPLSKIDGFVALLGQSFLAAADVENLQRHLGHTRRLAEGVSLLEVTTPDGLENLARAVRDQSANSAS